MSTEEDIGFAQTIAEAESLAKWADSVGRESGASAVRALIEALGKVGCLGCWRTWPATPAGKQALLDHIETCGPFTVQRELYLENIIEFMREAYIKPTTEFITELERRRLKTAVPNE